MHGWKILSYIVKELIFVTLRRLSHCEADTSNMNIFSEFECHSFIPLHVLHHQALRSASCGQQ